MENTPCSCGSNEKFLRRKGNATGLYCFACEKWSKWVGKKDLEVYKRRGFKVHAESYSPNPSPSVPTQPMYNEQNFGSYTHEQTHYPESHDNTPEYLQQYARPLDPQTVPQPPVEDFMEDPLPESFVDEDEPVSNNLLRQGAQQQHNEDPCRTCITGVLEPYGKTPLLSATISFGVLNIHNADKTKLYGSFELKYCPTCGRELE